MRIHDFSHISHILTSTERFMKKLLILLLGLLLLQISYSRSVLIPKKRPELVISKIYNPSSGKILVIYQCKDWLNRVTNSFAAPEFMIRIGSTIMSLSAADYDWTVSTSGNEWVKITDLNDMPLTAGTKSPYVQQIRITADVNPQTEPRPATVTFSSTDQTQTATVSVTQEAAGPAFPCQWIFSASTVGQYNSSWSASNMLPSTLGSSGYISVVRDDANAGREFTRTVSSYKPTVSTMVEGDYWLYTLPVKRLEAGTAVEFDATMAGEANSPKYFIVEYRKKEGFDAGIPESGLLIYRVDPRYTGNNAYDGSSKFDELYLFRPGGSTTSDGKIEQAAFSAESGRMAFGGEAAQKPFYTNGETARFAIGNISTCGETLSFDLLPVASRIYLPTDTVVLAGNAGSTTAATVEADTSWQITSVPEWLEISPTQGHIGKTTITITALTKNENTSSRNADIILNAIDEADVADTLTVSQASGEILAPSNLSATAVNGKVELTWSAPVSGSTVLNEDFENAASVANWTIRHDSENPKTWIHVEADKYTEVSDGTHAMKLESDWDSMHQDEWLISPSFAQGQRLDFHSKSIAPQKNNAHNFYYVLVSSDNGETWEILYDLKTQSTAVNVYEEISLDLTPYLSNEMRIAFRGYDDNNAGLSYWWIVDGIVVYPAAESSAITGYNIYRNGIKIATTDKCHFTDENIPEGEIRYQVSATTQYGETALSAPVGIDESSIDETPTTETAYYNRKSGLLIIPEADKVILTGIDGRTMSFTGTTQGYIDLKNIPEGFYIARIVSGNKSYVLKFFK